MLTKIYDKKPRGKELRKIRSIAEKLKPKIIIGKKGLTDEIIKNIKNKLKKEKVLKIRILRNAYFGKERKEYLISLCKKLIENSIKVAGIKGNTIVVYS